MRIDSDDYMTVAEAAELLGVTHQRVHSMINEGVLQAERPWQTTVVVTRRSVAEWLAGARPPSIRPPAARAWLLERTGSDASALDIDTVRDEMLEFITAARPAWDSVRRDTWALSTAARLFRTAGITPPDHT